MGTGRRHGLDINLRFRRFHLGETFRVSNRSRRRLALAVAVLIPASLVVFCVADDQSDPSANVILVGLAAVGALLIAAGLLLARRGEGD